ncbi:MAG: ATP-binding protein [Pseudomonadales bacterium]|nr:ATP-binding protein [Pseudomonadales bacterium]
MNNRSLLSMYGLKWNPFSPEIPKEGLITNDRTDKFIWKIENLVMDGGFAMISGDPGTGKSVVLRLINDKLEGMRDLTVGALSRPQSAIADFYREVGNLFGIELKGSNRFAGFKILREKWHNHIESSLLRPVLLIDEAQEMPATALNELRLLSSTEFDSKNILTVVLCGDRRLPEKFRMPDLIPLGSRIRTRLVMEAETKKDLAEFLEQSITLAGNPGLMTPGLIKTLAEQSSGNYRAMCIMAGELLAEAFSNKQSQLDEQIFFETFAPHKKARKKGARSS